MLSEKLEFSGISCTHAKEVFLHFILQVSLDWLFGFAKHFQRRANMTKGEMIALLFTTMIAAVECIIEIKVACPQDLHLRQMIEGSTDGGKTVIQCADEPRGKY